MGIYTNHWHRTVNSPHSSSLTGEPSSCRGGSEAEDSGAGGRCPRSSSEYVPDMDYDLQGIFEVDYSPEYRAASLEDIHYLRH